ncbi:hypothetical protein L6452_40062 [Arctium lappa]|uniref:Uncharacterized protein n=1 Tax=Arctium lappa TaxID=4217 RepID=A0ACB8XUQ3_ARCLA|nr:hypothetical protein L6452_40062 [Arctium lappa]
MVMVKVMSSNKKKKLVISMVEASLPPGFRFHPRDEELISDYLSNKVYNNNSTATDDDDDDDDDSNPHLPLLLQVDLNHCEPWDLPEMACVGGKEWYFYSQRDRKYATGLRTNRATVSGYWKATGKDRCIHDKRKQIVGMRKTLVFYLGRAPKGKKTDWVMHEFRLQSSPPADLHHNHSSLKDQDWVLCRVFCKNRELVGGKQMTTRCGSNNHEDTQSCSSSLPPLMDPNYSCCFSFDQSQATVATTNIDDMIFNQQVPCFSMINRPPPADIILFSNTNTNTISIPPPPAAAADDDAPNIIPSSISQSLDHYSSCEKKEVFKAILSRFNETDHECSATSLSFGQGISDQSFLSDAALPVTMWYP